MSRHDDMLSIRQMLEHAHETLELARGRTRSDLDSDRMFELAMTRLLEIIGEAAGRVSTATRDSQPQIPWSSVIGLRNRLIHGYDQVDRDILWKIIEDDLGSLADQLKVALAG
jgi:uncharacterized protein with HEPN domain